MNHAEKELTETLPRGSVFTTLIALSCKYRVSAAEFYDTISRFGMLQAYSPNTLSLIVANKSSIDAEHLKISRMDQRTYFLKGGQNIAVKLMEDIRTHLQLYISN